MRTTCATRTSAPITWTPGGTWSIGAPPGRALIERRSKRFTTRHKADGAVHCGRRRPLCVSGFEADTATATEVLLLHFPLDIASHHAILPPLQEGQRGVAMTARWFVVWSALAAVGGRSGCATSGPNLKPPLPERFALPPADDARFSEPISYPKDSLNQDTIVKPGATP